uniref:Uncharacterized protein n=1 Tax=Xenopus tropicalis TaxID=8364 RepID=A0A1B8Y9J2_XENTR
MVWLGYGASFINKPLYKLLLTPNSKCFIIVVLGGELVRDLLPQKPQRDRCVATSSYFCHCRDVFCVHFLIFCLIRNKLSSLF